MSAKLEKLKNELKKTDEKIREYEQKKSEIQNKIKLEEQEQLQKLMKDRNISFDEVIALLK